MNTQAGISLNDHNPSFEPERIKGILLAVIPTTYLAFVVLVLVSGRSGDSATISFCIYSALLSTLLLTPAYLIADPRLLNSGRLTPRDIWLFCLFPAALLMTVPTVLSVLLLNGSKPQPGGYSAGEFDPEYAEDLASYSLGMFLGSCQLFALAFSWIVNAIGFRVFVKKGRTQQLKAWGLRVFIQSVFWHRPLNRSEDIIGT